MNRGLSPNPFMSHARVNLASIEATLVIRIYTLIQAANELIEALPRLHGNGDDMNRHRERFDNFFRMCTKLFTEVYYKFDLLRAFLEEMRTNTNRAIEQDANFGTSTVYEVVNREIDSIRSHVNWDVVKGYVIPPHIPSDYECLHSSHDINEYNWPFGLIDELIDDLQGWVRHRVFSQVDNETNDVLPYHFEDFRTSIRRILLTIYDEELGSASPYNHNDTDSVSIAYGTDDNNGVELGNLDESSSNNNVIIGMDILSIL